jgi:type II secretory pathway pseudopilin PulG
MVRKPPFLAQALLIVVLTLIIMKQTPSRLNRSKAGFTITEVMFSSFLMAFVLAISLQVLGLSIRKIRTAENQMKAMHQARYELEQLRSLPFDSSDLDVGTYSLTLPSGATELVNAEYTVTGVNADLSDLLVRVRFFNHVTRRNTPVELKTSLIRQLH